MKLRLSMLLMALIAVTAIVLVERQPRGALDAPRTALPQTRGGDGLWSVRPPSFWAEMPLPQARPRSTSWVDARVEKWRVRGGDTTVERLGFASSVRQALTLAREHHRLLFLLVDRGSVFRCRS